MPSAPSPAAPVSVLIVTVDGQATPATWAPSAANGLLVPLQQAVGGDVDVVQLHPLLSMWVYGEGLFALPFNPLASLVAAGMGFEAQPYCGTAVFTGGVDGDGADLTLSRKLAGSIVEMGEELRAAPEMLAGYTRAAEPFLAHYR